jgi:aprataxin
MDALRQYALVKQPAKQISSSVRLANSDSTITIFDAFPKARYHFLCLPRLPFSPSVATGTQGAIFIDPNALDSLATLLRLPANVAQMVLVDLKHAADEAKEMINDEMLKTEGFVWDVNVGFHSSPSMPYVN